MNQFVRNATLGWISIAWLLAGCSTGAPEARATPPKSVPGIAVVVDCGDCHVRPSVPELIRTAYASAAAKSGASIADDKAITLTITDYTERSLAMRSLSLIAGPLALALKDEIRAVAVIDGTPLPLDYSVRLPFLGIEAVASKLGELSFATVGK